MDGTDGDSNGICLPYDLLLDILRQLPCRSLAQSRLVCRAWRAIVDGHKLLFPHFFPQGPFPGIFTRNFDCDDDYDKSSFFAPSMPARLGQLRGAHDGPVFRLPPTIRCATLPIPEDERLWLLDRIIMFLAFDPAVSLHHEVFSLPSGNTLEYTKIAKGGAQHPEDKVIPVLVFSSQTNQWARREFVPGHLYDMVTAPHPKSVRTWKSAEYWRGSLYVHCWNNIIMILHNSDGLYDMAQLPGKAYDDENQYLEYGH
ncbi:hypothetical protein VPH35_107170 [Triticum aestivum]